MLGTRPKPLKGYPQWVREGAGNRGEPEGPPTLPPLVHWIASSHPLLLGFLPLAPFKKKYKAFLHNFSLFLPLPTLLEFPPPQYSLTSCTPPSSYSPRLLTPLSFSIRGTNRRKINFLKKQPNGNIWTQNCKPLSVVISCSPWLYEDIYCKIFALSGLLQASIHTGFHCFNKNSQIFRKIYIFFFDEEKKLSKLKSGQYPARMTPKARKGDLREVKRKKIPRGACPHTPLETCAFCMHMFRKLVNI